MSTLNKIFLSVLTVGFIFLAGCGSEESGPSITSVRLNVEPNVVFVEVGSSLSLSASDQNGNDISDIVSFLVNGNPTSSTSFTVQEAGAIELAAEYENL